MRRCNTCNIHTFKITASYILVYISILGIVHFPFVQQILKTIILIVIKIFMELRTLGRRISRSDGI